MTDKSASNTKEHRVIREEDISVQDADKRGQSREPLDKPVEILPCARLPGDERFVTVRLRDCSLDGLGLLADFPMKPGEQFLAKLELDGLMLMLYTVRHCEPAPGGGHRIGAEFTRVAASRMFDGDGSKILRNLTRAE